MHRGRFPSATTSGNPEPYRRSPNAPADLEPRPSRRAWLLGVLGLGAGASATVWWTRGGERGTRSSDDRTGRRAVGDQQQRGTVDWAIALLAAEPEVLLASAGDAERVSMRHRREARLVPVFERILDLALASSQPDADVAGACAVRSLERLEQNDVLARWARAVGARGDLLLTNEAIAEHRSRLARSTRGGK